MAGERTVKVRLTGDVSDYSRAIAEAEAETKGFSKSLDSSNDRMSNLVQTSLALGPALVPIGAAGVPVIAGLSNELGFAVAGAGVFVLAFHGVGTALKAVNDYAIEPTDAHLQAMNDSLAKLGPSGRDFVESLQKLRPELQGLESTAQENLFPGLTAGISDAVKQLPQVERIVAVIAKAGGDLAAEGGANLDDPKWQEFFNFLETEARPTLLDMSRTVGNFGEAFANLWMAFSPVSDGFAHDFLQLSQDFNKWTDGLDKTQGFQDFLDYVSKEGPQVWETLGALGNTLLQITEAAAPVGAEALPIIRDLADAVSTLASSDVGPLVIGLVSVTSALSRIKALGVAANSSAIGTLFTKSPYGGVLAAAKDLPAASREYMTLGSSVEKTGYTLGQFSASSERLRASLKGTAKLAGGAGGLAFVMSDLDNKMGLSNTTSLALAGSLLGPEGAALGGAIGLTKDLADANNGLWSSLSRAKTVLDSNTSSLADQAAAVDAARLRVAEFKQSVDDPSGPFTLDNFKSLKNGIEGFFGKSDVQEAEASLKKLENQQAKNSAAAQDLAFSEAGLGTSMYGATQDARDQADAILKLVDAHNKLDNENLAAANANIAYEQALDAAAEGARKNKKGLDDNLPSGRANLALLYQLAGTWNGLTSEQQNAAGASDRARKQFIDIAIVMGATRKEAKKLADEYLDIPTDVSTKVHLDGAAGATKEVLALTRALNKIPGLTTATVATIEETFVVPKKKVPTQSLNQLLTGGLKKAGGGEISGPGGPRDDLIPLLASNKEFMVNAYDAQENLPLLHAINDGKFRGGRPATFANGGPVMQGIGGGRHTWAPAELGGFTARLVDPTVRMHKDGLLRLIDERVEIGVSQNDAYQGKR